MREIDPNLPIDKTAALVVSVSKNQGLEFTASQCVSSMVPLPTKQFPGPKEHDLTGRKVGRFTVIGCALWRANGRVNTIRWVVKCSCGRYQMMRSKVVKYNHPDNMCQQCKKIKSTKYKGSNDSEKFGAYFRRERNTQEIQEKKRLNIKNK